MADSWFILRDGQRHGPYTAGQMKAHVRTGHLLPIDLVIKDGMAKPVTAAKVKGLFPSGPDRTTPPVSSPPIRPPVGNAEPVETPARTGRVVQVRPRYVVIAGAVAVTFALIVVAVIVGSGRKGRNVAGDGPASASARSGGASVEVEAELPDFTQVDYTLDTSKLNYEQGPNGEKLIIQERNDADGAQAMSGFKNGEEEFVIHGLAAGKYRDGSRRFETEYFAGKEHGKHTEWYPDGQVLKQGLMKEGRQHGKWTEYHKSGEKASETHYLGDVPHGQKVEWYAARGKLSESTWVSGERRGTEVVWNERGDERFRLHWVRGVPHFRPQANTRAAFLQAEGYLHRDVLKAQLDKFLETFGEPDAGYVVGTLPTTDTQGGVVQKWVFACRDGSVELEARVFGANRVFRDRAGSTTKLVLFLSIDRTKNL